MAKSTRQGLGPQFEKQERIDSLFKREPKVFVGVRSGVGRGGKERTHAGALLEEADVSLNAGSRRSEEGYSRMNIFVWPNGWPKGHHQGRYPTRVLREWLAGNRIGK